MKKSTPANPASAHVREFGKVTAVYDEILRIEGFPSISAGEILESPNGGRAFVFGFDEDHTFAAVLGKWNDFAAGSKLLRTKTLFQAPVGEQFLGRAVNVFGKPLDGKGDVSPDAYVPVEREAPVIIARESVHEPLSTGILAVDAAIPLGRGQRELIIGDRKTGKTSLALSAVINQRQSWWEAGGLKSYRKGSEKPVVCVYVSIGQKQSDIAHVMKTLEEQHALDYTTVVAATASDSATENYLAPYVGTSMAEYFRDKGYDALIIYDDLTKHAWAYRNLSLLLGRPPGREAYPGDVFYIHAKLLERSAKLNSENGSGSLTALPIIETVEGDITGYISTNLISITDGQIYLSPEMFRKGMRPAVNIGLSVSRVGSAAQIKAIKKLTGKLKLELSQAAELRKVAEVSPQSLSKESKAVLEKGDRILSVLGQEENQLYRLPEQACIWAALFSGKIDDISSKAITHFLQSFVDFIRQADDPLLTEIESTEWSDTLQSRILEHLAKFRQMHTL